MASLKDLRRRIGSVKNTQQITSAMKLVAASKLRRAQQAILGARPYADRVEELSRRLLKELMATVQESSEEKRAQAMAKLHPLLTEVSKEEAPKRALIVISSTRGLCGGYNTVLARTALKHYRELVANGEQVELFFYGRKAADIFRRFQFRGQLNDEFWSKPLTTAVTDQVANVFIEKYLNKEFHKVEVVFTEFKSALNQIPTVKTILPLEVEAPAADSAEPTNDLPYIYEPQKEKLLATLLPKWIMTQVYRVFASSYASEVGSRMTAMENATRNAGQMISKLTLLANRTRQAAITTELTEIVGGAEALKG